MSYTGIRRIGKISGLPPLRTERTGRGDINADTRRDRPDDLPDDLRSAVGIVGEENVRAVHRLRQRGFVGTIPELLAEDYLIRIKANYQKQVTIPEAHARVDLIVVPDLAFRIQGVYWHPLGRQHDADQRWGLELMGFRVVDIWETRLYRQRDRTMKNAMAGVELGR